MSDIAIVWSPSLGVGDWYYEVAADGLVTDENGNSIVDETGAPILDGLFSGATDLIVGNELGTAVMISLFTDAQADEDDTIPDGSADPRGWWGDLDEDRHIGSKLWLLSRAKQTNTTLALAQSYIGDALQWLIDDEVADSIDVFTEWSWPGFLGAQIVIHRSNGTTATVRFDWAWQDLS
jgi:phage gp46-like protein